MYFVKRFKSVFARLESAALRKFVMEEWLAVSSSSQATPSITKFLKLHYLVKSLTSEATASATQFFKRSYKISHNPGL